MIIVAESQKKNLVNSRCGTDCHVDVLNVKFNKLIPYELYLKHVFYNDNYSHKQKYAIYLLTDRWASLSRKRLDHDQNNCRMCPNKAQCVHHRKYPAIFGEETIRDLTSLCHECHNNFHNPPGIEEIKLQFFTSLENGEKKNCPCCGKYCAFEARPLNATMARGLLWLVRKYESNGGNWINVPSEGPSWITRTNQHTTLAKWGLIERRKDIEGKKENKRYSGDWRPTQKGIDFVNRELAIPWKVVLWDDKKIGHSDATITLKEALRSGGFNYKDIMKNPDADVAAVTKRIKIKKEGGLIFNGRD